MTLSKAIKVFISFIFFLSTAKAESFNVSAKLINFSPDQEQKVQTALEIIRKIIPSEEFKNAVINKQYRGKKIYVDNLGLSNEEIYQKIINEGKIDLELKLYNEESNTIGYTYPNIIRIYINQKYFNRFSPSQVADNLVHEWLHKIGFNHEFKYSKTRDHSVPYSIGYLVRELASKPTPSKDDVFTEVVAR